MTQKIPIQPAHDREEQGRMAGPEWAGIPKQIATTKPQGLEFSAVGGDHGFRAVLVQPVEVHADMMTGPVVDWPSRPSRTQPAPLEPVMPFTADAIATILHAPRENVEAHWPLVLEALGALKILEPAVEVAAIASIGTESYLFAPEREAGTEAYFRRMYEFDRSLGNLEPGDGPRYCGRGFVPLVGRSEYARFGKLVGADLVEQPDLALDPAVAARILAYDFMLKGVPKAAAEDDWVKVRRLIHGDLSGWKRFNGILIPLLKQLP